MLSFVNKVLIFLIKPDQFSPKAEISGPIASIKSSSTSPFPCKRSTTRSTPLFSAAPSSVTPSKLSKRYWSGTSPNTVHRANTPLMWAVGEKATTIICIALLDAGAEADILNATNYTALSVCRRKRSSRNSWMATRSQQHHSRPQCLPRNRTNRAQTLPLAINREPPLSMKLKNHSEALLQWHFYIPLEPLSNRPNNRLKKWLKPTTGGHPKTSLESANLRMKCKLMLRNLKFQYFVTWMAAMALYKSFEGFRLQAKVDKF